MKESAKGRFFENWQERRKVGENGRSKHENCKRKKVGKLDKKKGKGEVYIKLLSNTINPHKPDAVWIRLKSIRSPNVRF